MCPQLSSFIAGALDKGSAQKAHSASPELSTSQIRQGKQRLAEEVLSSLPHLNTILDDMMTIMPETRMHAQTAGLGIA